MMYQMKYKDPFNSRSSSRSLNQTNKAIVDITKTAVVAGVGLSVIGTFSKLI